MTSSPTEWPLRGHGQSWPGLKTRRGIIMRLPGEMSDCKNVIINRGDVLEKRKGMVRGFDEQFDGPVCGLFVYTDSCGQEYVLVADSVDIKIRTPFLLPTFTVADCYPTDGFDGVDGSAIDTDVWRNTAGYEIQGNAMVQVAGALPDDDNDETALTAAMRWFKEACSTRYQVQTQYSFSDPCPAKQKHILAVRGTGDLSSGPVVFAVLEFCTGTVYRVKIVHRDAAGTLTTLQTQTGITGDPSGFFRLSYDSSERTAAVLLTVDGGASVDITSAPLTAIEDIDLGLITGVGISFEGSGTPSTSNAVLNISGESLG